MSEHTFFITLLTIEMIIPHAQSLKDKRSVIRGLKDRISSKFNASVAEVGYQDKWQRAVLAVSLVGGDKRQLESNSDRINCLCAEFSNLEIVSIVQEWL
ncbi:hypothetical protein A9Q79_04380 [Methylophaga sp. 42_25_T18]|nr:hypothetical protein A9Q79_04380 [Methylophaga sp. 42_25_T18]OUR89761.1 hypothetical protein A9Q92_00465 [Methylophaga sp. 42_8_T64]